MPAMHDFRCPRGHEFEEIGTWGVSGVMPVRCPYCTEMAKQIWKKAPGIHSDEAPPRDRLAAAREHLGFTGSTRAELEAFEKQQGVIPMSGDEVGRYHETKKPALKPEQKAHIAEVVKDTLDKAEAGKLENPADRAITETETIVLGGAAKAGNPAAAAILKQTQA